MSAFDNFELKDGLANPLFVRGKDVSTAQDGSLRRTWVINSSYPVDYGIGGCYHLTSKSGSMAAGLAANAPIYSFRWTSATLNAIVRRIRVSAWSLGTGFAAGLATFDLLRAHGWTVADTGGTFDILTGDNGNLRLSMATTAITEIRHSSTATLTAGTRVVDSQTLDTLVATVGTATNTAILQRIPLFEVMGSEHPLVLTQNEGFVIQATVPATGVWAFAVTTDWEEVPLVNY